MRRVQGLEASAVRRLLERAVEAPERGDLVRRVGLERNRLMQGGVLEVREVASDVAANLGGLGVLKRYLEDVRDLFAALAESKHERRHLEALIPKGVLLVGLPGCGKSLSAEVAASMLSLPLLQLHMGRLMDRYLGASESRLDAALAAATAAAPCVLWIDELEKAVGGLGGSEGSGTGGRMLGRLLGWMQDNRRGVFVNATANKLDHVPPELLRRGRFDDHFVVGLPNTDERTEILAQHLPEPEWTTTTRMALARDLKDYSGADLVALVREAQRVCWRETQTQTPTRKHIDGVRADGFKPQAEQWKSDFDAMRKSLEQRGFRSASDVEGKPAPTRVKRAAQVSELPDALRELLESTTEQRFDFTLDGLELTLSILSVDGKRIARIAPTKTSTASQPDYFGNYTIGATESHLSLAANWWRGRAPQRASIHLDANAFYFASKMAPSTSSGFLRTQLSPIAETKIIYIATAFKSKGSSYRIGVELQN